MLLYCSRLGGVVCFRTAISPPVVGFGSNTGGLWQSWVKRAVAAKEGGSASGPQWVRNTSSQANATNALKCGFQLGQQRQYSQTPTGADCKSVGLRLRRFESCT